MVDWNKYLKAVSLSGALLIAFVANKWFEQAYIMQTDFAKWFMLFMAMLILTIPIYWNLPDK
ncbi:MAG: hypothetical protein KAR87_01380 [Candidatus Aenigmarchaeota archaeon]|nr:hypothetical protein [Candidatus Aenigmarchaeota archaeon]